MQKTMLIILICLFPVLVVAQIDSISNTNSTNAESIIKDSLEFVFNENLTRKLDSLQQNLDLQKQKFLNKYNVEREQYAKKIQTLADSLKILKTHKSTPPVLSSINSPQINTLYENLYFQYLKNLKEGQKKSTSIFNKLGLGGEKLINFQLSEMNNYQRQYFPDARSEEIQRFIIDLCFNKKLYAQAEMELLKYAFLYFGNDNYAITIDKNLKIINKKRYYKNRDAFINKKINSILTNTQLSDRYYNFIDLLNSYPEKEVKAFFHDEAIEYLDRYKENPKSAQVFFWIAEEYLNNQENHKAFITAGKIMTIFPNHNLFPEALFFQANIQETKFKEYKDAIGSYEKFYSKFPSHPKAQLSMYKIPIILDTQLKDYESAVSYYKQFADQYKKSDNAIIALQRTAEIYNKEMKALQSAIDTYLLIEERYPNSEYGKQALFMTGSLYENNKYYKTAVVHYAEVYKKYPKSDESETALKRSAILFLDKLDDQENAIKVLNLIIEYFPNSKSAKQASERLDSLSEKTEPTLEQKESLESKNEESTSDSTDTETTNE